MVFRIGKHRALIKEHTMGSIVTFTDGPYKKREIIIYEKPSKKIVQLAIERLCLRYNY